MPTYKVEKSADLTILPQPRPIEAIFTENTVGDLHANAIKLIYILVEIGLLVGLSQDDYDKIITIYNTDLSTPEIASKKLTLFFELVDAMKFSSLPIKLRLLGDELCDRGMNDIYVLIVIAKMAKAKIDFEILISNHSMEFIRCFDNEKPYNYAFNLSEGKQRRSSSNFQKLIDWQIVDKSLLQDILIKYYFPRLKLISYSIDEKERICIFTHAPVGLKVINDLYLDLYESDITKEGMQTTLEALILRINLCNKRFQDFYVANLCISRLFDYRSFYSLIWNRKPSLYQDRPTLIQSANGAIKSSFMHGHENISDDSGHLSFDNEFGRGDDFLPGIYTLLGSRESELEKEYEGITNLNNLAVKFKEEVPGEGNFIVSLNVSSFFIKGAQPSSKPDKINITPIFSPLIEALIVDVERMSFVYTELLNKLRNLKNTNLDEGFSKDHPFTFTELEFLKLLISDNKNIKTNLAEEFITILDLAIQAELSKYNEDDYGMGDLEDDSFSC